MTLYALDAIDDAATATRELLWPFDLGRWLRLVVVVFFLGGAAGNSGLAPFQFSGSAPSGFESAPTPSGSPEMALPGGTELAVIGAIVGVIALLVLGFLLVGSVMEFVFVESLREEQVRVRAYWSRYWGQGLRLFGFRLVLALLSLGVVVGIFAAALGPYFLGFGGAPLAFILLAIPVFVLLSVVSGLLGGFTTMFIVPVMLLEDRGLLSAWRRFWPTLRTQWKQYAAYAVVGWVLQLAAGIAASVAVGFAAVVAGIPLGIVGLVGIGLLGVAEIVGGIVVAIAAVLFGLVVLALVLLVGVPVQAYLRYHALFVLGDTDAAFDVIPERRRAVRE
jgi:hypothetical protein